MTVKEYLSGARVRSNRLDVHLRSLKRLCGRGDSAGAPLWGIYQELSSELRGLQCHQAQMIRLIGCMPDDAQRQVLTLRYLCGMRWEQIACDMHYSSRHLQRLHHKALASLNAVQDFREQETQPDT